MSEIKKCEDGTYRWIYEFSMLKNPIILLTVLKIFALVLIGMWMFFGLFLVKDEGFFGAFVYEAKALILPAAILFALSIVSYLILAGIYGWKYIVLFEMNEEAIRHIHMNKQFKKAEAMGWLTALIGAASGHPGISGTGLLAATKQETVTEFSKVKKMKVLRGLHTIKLDGLLNHNQIYANGEDYDFVVEYIKERIPE
ncbi:MAG: hypothetical protein KBT19_02295 [Lachnospiraceae bacterium]|nr:hypothetical protein [Candidatus Colinaster equi]